MPPERILVVDDNVDIARSIAVLLTSWGHEVHLAHDGRTAIAAARLVHPDFIFLDLGLPGVDGFQVAAALRHDPTLQAVRIIAVTGLTQEDDRRRSMEAGIDQHLIKPLNLGFLKSLLGRRSGSVADTGAPSQQPATRI